MIQTIVNEYHWTPKTIDELYYDELDHHGLVFWYENIKDMHDKIPKVPK